MRHVDIFRWREWTSPVLPVSREVLTSQPVEETGLGPGPALGAPRAEPGKPPLLFVAGYAHGAWAFAEKWLEHAAGRGYPAYAMSLRGHGESGSAARTTLRAYAHDVVQVAARLPRQAVLLGHGVGGLAVAIALARYPARAGVLIAPVAGGLRTVAAAFAANPTGTLPALVGAPLRLRRRQLFGRELSVAEARDYANRLGDPVAPRVMYQLARRHMPPRPVGDAPVLVVGSPDDKVVPRATLEWVARHYGAAPLLFPGMGHDLMLDARWQEPIDAIIDWLDKL
jgi:pimeloyl-ACP methyl ester carboxylesterase